MSLKNKQNYCFIVLKAHRSGHVVVQNTESLPIQETGPITTTEYIVFTVFCIVLQFYFSQSEIERKKSSFFLQDPLLALALKTAVAVCETTITQPYFLVCLVLTINDSRKAGRFSQVATNIQI